MRKNVKKITIIILELIICCFICEFSCFYFELYRVYPFVSRGLSPIEYLVKATPSFFKDKFISFDKFYENITFRPVSGSEYKNKKSIILFGCSFAHGTSELKDNQTISYKLSKLTKRKVYNRANPGWGIQNMLYQLRRKDFYNIVKEEPEYIIYLYWSHFNRLYEEVGPWDIQVFYKKAKENRLKESYFMQGKFPFYGFSAKEIRKLIANKKMKDKEASYKFMLKHFEESKKEIKEHWSNAKFVIFVYYAQDDEKEFLKRMRKEEGYNIIFLDELSNIDFNTLEYQLMKTDIHPNEKAWDKIVPLLVKKLDVK